MGFLEKWQPQLLSVLRIVTGLLFLEHGMSKILHFPPSPMMPAHLPMIIVVAGWIELVTGALVTVGLFTRLAAFVASGEMAFAYFMGHAPKGFYPAINGGEDAILLCFIFLYLAAAGPGTWSLSRR